MNEIEPPRPGGEIIVYQSEDGGNRIRVLLEGETVWLTQAMIAELYQTTVPNVNIHLKNIYDTGELTEAATIKEYLIVRQEGSRQVSRKVLHYNLEAILAVSYRVQSPRGVQFRQWATARLHEYLVNTTPSPSGGCWLPKPKPGTWRTCETPTRCWKRAA